MQITKFTRNHWIFILCLVGIGIAFFAFYFFNYSTSQSPVQQIAIMPSITQTPAVSTTTSNTNTSKFISSIPYIAPYRVIPRNATYVPSKPLMEPVDFNRTYSINVNPPSDPNAGIHRGTVFEMSGTTDLPVGSELRVQITTGKGGPTKATRVYVPIDCIYDAEQATDHPGIRFFMIGTIYVEPPLSTLHLSISTLNTWRFIVDSQMLGEDEYLVWVGSPHKSIDGIDLIHVIGSFDNEVYK